MNGREPQDFVYTDERVAKAVAKEKEEEWTSYEPKMVMVRPLGKDEGAVGKMLVQIRRQTWQERCVLTALKKLTKDEREALAAWIEQQLKAK